MEKATHPEEVYTSECERFYVDRLLNGKYLLSEIDDELFILDDESAAIQLACLLSAEHKVEEIERKMERV